MTMLISIHIPETSGAAFGAMLREHFGDRLCFDYYSLRDHNHRPMGAVPPGTECLHGHFIAGKYREQFPGSTFVTWLRDPGERVASEYEFLKSNPDPQSGLSQLIANGGTLLDFAEHPYARNTQARYLDGMTVGQFAFVGLSEHFEREIYRFIRLTGIPLPIAVGVDADAARKARSPVPAAARRRILALNPEDLALYESAEKSVAGPSKADTPAKGAGSGRGDRPTEPGPALDDPYLQPYANLVARLVDETPGESAMEAAVGGEFFAIGMLEFSLLRSLGLTDGATVVDVGCGSGRLALPLSTMPGVSYLGTDLVPELLAHARRITARGDWTFERAKGLAIPCRDATADFVCFFSVLTHLRHEDSFRYLAEAKRALKPGGKIVFSFLEFYRPSHWSVFQRDLAEKSPDEPINQFIEREAIKAWAHRLGLLVVSIHDGDKPHIPLAREVRWQNGIVMKQLGNLGQSVAVLEKP